MSREVYHVVFAMFLASVLALCPLLAQVTDTPPSDPPVEFSTWPGPGDLDEPDGKIDPANLEYPVTLGEPILPSEEDPALQNDSLAKPEDDKLIYPLGLMASSKNLGANVSEDIRAELSSNAHYFSSTTANGPAVVLVGVSADNACHFNSTGIGQCSYGPGGATYKLFLDDLVAQGLNVIRLWVSIVGSDTTSKPTPTTCPGKAPPTPSNQLANTDNPFLYDSTHGTTNGVGRFWLDDPAGRNADYFSRLAAVVDYANNHNILVEVTLFSPLTGNIGIGPYGKNHAYKSDGTLLPGFTDTANFMNVTSPEYLAMKTYVWNVVHWTVDALHSYPNVYFEVANEPENVRLSTTNSAGCGNNSEEVLNSTKVSEWQNSIANELRAYEMLHYVTPHGNLAHPHLVAVEPSTTFGAATFVSGGAYAAAGNVINSHYTTISPKGTAQITNLLSAVGLGAVKMMRANSSQSKIFGFNESKITGGVCAGTGTGGSVAGQRAEAWEFLLNQGGVYNGYGYDCSGVHNCTLIANAGDPYCQSRIQLGFLRRFLTDQLVNVVFRMKTSAPVDDATPNDGRQNAGTPWINVGKYGFQETPTRFKFWAALDPTGNAQNKRWLLYIHHSRPSDTVDGGYVAVPTAGGYKETGLSVCLLGAPAGRYVARWYKNPESAVAISPSHVDMMIDWPAPATCTPGGTNAVPLPETSPGYDYHYDYDEVLLISK